MSKITDYTRTHKVGFTLAIIGVIIVIAFVSISYVTLTYGGKVKVTVNLVPSDASLTINGKKEGIGDLYLQPGTYDIVATKDGYRKFQQKFTVESGQQETPLPVSLVAESDAAEQEAKKNQNDYLKNEGLGSRRADIEGAAFVKRNPIVEKLPYKTLLYTIGYRADTSDPTGMSITIEIDTSEGRRADVVEQIVRWGYDPTEMNIAFRNYENPFDEK